MIAIANWQYSQANPEARMIMQVHDELVFEVRNDAIESARHTIKHLMEHAIELSVPLIVSIGTGANWDEAH